MWTNSQAVLESALGNNLPQAEDYIPCIQNIVIDKL